MIDTTDASLPDVDECLWHLALARRDGIQETIDALLDRRLELTAS